MKIIIENTYFCFKIINFSIFKLLKHKTKPKTNKKATKYFNNSLKIS